MDWAVLAEVCSFVGEHERSDRCPVVCIDMLKDTTCRLSAALKSGKMVDIDESQLTGLLDQAARNWPFSGRDVPPGGGGGSDILDTLSKTSTHSVGDIDYTCIRSKVFELLERLSRVESAALLMSRVKWVDRFPGWLKSLLPKLDHAQPHRHIQDPELQQASRICLSIVDIASRCCQVKAIGKHVFFLCAEVLGVNYRPDVATYGSLVHFRDPLAEAFASFYRHGLQFATEDLSLRLMHNGTCAKLRDLANQMGPRNSASFALLHFDLPPINPAYAQTQGVDEREALRRNRKQGATLREEANAMFKCSNFTKAYECYKKSAQACPYDAKTWCNLVLCCQKLNKNKEAKEAAFTALEKDPGWWKSWCRVGDVLRKKSVTSDLAYLAYLVADNLVNSAEIAERLAEMSKGGGGVHPDIEQQFHISDPKMFFTSESEEKTSLFTAYHTLHSTQERCKALPPLVGETLIVSAATFGTKSTHFKTDVWMMNAWSHRRDQPVLMCTNVGKPSAEDVVRVVKRAICHPMDGGRPGVPSCLLLSHRLAVAHPDLVEALLPVGVRVQLETKKEAEFSCLKHNTDPSGDNSDSAANT